MGGRRYGLWARATLAIASSVLVILALLSNMSARPIRAQTPNPDLSKEVTEKVKDLWKECKGQAACVRDRLTRYIQENQPLFASKPALLKELRRAIPKASEESPPNTRARTASQRAIEAVGAADPGLGRKFGTVVVPVYFHVIHDGEKGKLTSEVLAKQLEVMNRAFKGLGFEFTHKQTEWVNNSNWLNLDDGSAKAAEMKKALSRQPHEILNIYFTTLAGGLLNTSTFPSDLANNPQDDGLLIYNETVPGGSAMGYNQGKTAVHAVGHWLGLYHTFQGGCDPPGDEVDDTPPIDSPSFGHPELGSRESCIKGVAALTNNFMDYVDDACMTSFTPGQVARMKVQVALFRPLLLDEKVRESLKAELKAE